MTDQKFKVNPVPMEGLAVPTDDGATDHLTGMSVPSVTLPSTKGRMVDVSTVSNEYVVLFVYPLTGSPNHFPISSDPAQVPDAWKQLPGACGCTSQVCGFRNHYEELVERGVSVFGISNNDTEYQKEAAERLELPFELLSDKDMSLTKALNLPTFEYEGLILMKRLSLIIHKGKIVKVFYPIFPPNTDAENVLRWLDENH